MTTTHETTTKLPRPLYAVAGVGELAYRRLLTLPGRVEALRERITPRVRTLREELPGRVEALRAEVPARVTTLVAEARGVYGGLVAHGEKIVDSARTRRTAEGIVATPTKAVKAVKKAVKKAAAPKTTTPRSRGPRA
jgi:hypothetical protein